MTKAYPEADFYRPAAIDVTASSALTIATAALLRGRYSVAWLTAAHMAIDSTTLAGLSALAGGSIQALANARANVLKAAVIFHFASVGSSLVDGGHKAAGNSATLAAIAPATDLTTCITLINGLLAALAAHGAASGVHFNNDAVLSAVAITTDPPATLPHCVTDLNDLLAAMVAHFALGTT